MESRTETVQKKASPQFFQSSTPGKKKRKKSATDYLISLTGTVPGLRKQYEQ